MDKIFCYNCFHEKDSSAAVCPNCGYNTDEDKDKYPQALSGGTVLGGRYILGRVLGQGGFGITYVAKDWKTGQLIAVKEYLPDSLAVRSGGSSVIAYSRQQEESFLYGKECFLNEAKTLAEFIGNPNIVQVHSYFEENGTAYFVMDYVKGISFQQHIQNCGGRIDWKEAEKILFPVMDALAAVHARGIIHRDVTPDNIYIAQDGIVKLLDFGAARYSMGDRSRSLDIVLKHGFAPKEQYTRHGRQGPYTDVYSLAASFYYAITGRKPPDSIDRMEEDDLVPPDSLGVNIPDYIEKALDKGMAVRPAERFQDMSQFKAAMMNEAGEVEAVSQSYSATQLPVKEALPPVRKSGVTIRKQRRLVSVISVAVAILAVMSAIIIVVNSRNSSQDGTQTLADVGVDEDGPARIKTPDMVDEKNAGEPEEDELSKTEPEESILVTIEMKEQEHTETAEDGTVYYMKNWTYPVVTIEGNRDVAEKINADIGLRVDEYYTANSEIAEWAKEAYENSLTEDYFFTSYSDEMTFRTVRADSRVISFAITYFSYMGGAHGDYAVCGVNYDAETGEKLSFSDLSADSESFRQKTLEYNQWLAGTNSYREQMFSEEDITNGSLEEALYADDAWYLSVFGLTFISNPYELGPYSSGCIEFIIPSAVASDMGLLDSYAYQGRKVLWLQNHSIYMVDLDADGQNEEVSYYTEGSENEDGIYVSQMHLIINGTDLAMGDDGILSEQLAKHVWENLILYDLDVEDDYLELVFLSGEMEGDNYVPGSYFFRYADDSLIYMGKVEGHVDDPTVDTSGVKIQYMLDTSGVKLQ